MNASVLVLGGMGLFYFAFKFYSNFLSSKIFKIQELTIDTPSVEFEDGVDFVPTDKEVLWGHHFSSIAGAAPIVGPAVAAIWGWAPAIIWIILGVIFMGAVHDYGALILSMIHKGDSIGNISEKILGKRVRKLVLITIFFLVWMVIAVFALVIANLFITFPSSVIPVNFEIFIAVAIGVFINRGNKKLLIPSLIAQVLLILMIYLGTQYPIHMNFLGHYKLEVWMIFLMIYSFIASVLPVNILLQPRDFINGHQLVFGLGLIIIGLIISSPTIVAPAFNSNPEGAPSWFPYLFITIACGAISGFHGLVSSGTTSKQVKEWKDTRNIGYGAMLGEGLLALIATVAVCAGFDSAEIWHEHYANWNAANGLSAKIGAFVLGSSKFISSIGIDRDFAATIVSVLIISFAATSLDTACRIQRYIISEFSEGINFRAGKNRYIASLIAVLSAMGLMFASSGGKGGLYLWPLFGATNQMLAGLTLMLITVYLFKKGRGFKNFLIPGVFIFIVTSISLITNIYIYYSHEKLTLALLGTMLFLVQLFITTEAFKEMKKFKA